MTGPGGAPVDPVTRESCQRCGRWRWQCECDGGAKLHPAAAPAPEPETLVDPETGRLVKAGKKRPEEPDVYEAIVAGVRDAGGALHDGDSGAWYLWSSLGWRRADNKVMGAAFRRQTRAKWPVVNAAMKRAAAVYALREPGGADPLDPRGLVGFPDGTVWDGETIRPAEPADYVTKRTAAAPAASCARWEVFVRQWCGGDADAAAALQQTQGIALLGETDRRFLVLEGPRRTGKTTFLAAVSRAFGDYGSPVSSRLWVAGDDHETLMASLRGLRFAWSDEVPAGRSMAAERVKAISGGEQLAARFMRRDHFEFEPQALLVLAANDIPFLRTPDDALIDRMRRVPFRTEFRHDPGFAKALRDGHLNAEIVRWAVDGFEACGGVTPECEAWTRATARYERGQDLPRAVRAVIVADPGRDFLGKAEVVRALKGWWVDGALGRPPHPREIHAELRRQHPEVEETKRAGVRGYRGLAVADAYAQPELTG